MPGGGPPSASGTRFNRSTLASSHGSFCGWRCVVVVVGRKCVRVLQSARQAAGRRPQIADRRSDRPIRRVGFRKWPPAHATAAAPPRQHAGWPPSRTTYRRAPARIAWILPGTQSASAGGAPAPSSATLERALLARIPFARLGTTAACKRRASSVKRQASPRQAIAPPGRPAGRRVTGYASGRVRRVGMGYRSFVEGVPGCEHPRCGSSHGACRTLHVKQSSQLVSVYPPGGSTPAPEQCGDSSVGAFFFFSFRGISPRGHTRPYTHTPQDRGTVAAVFNPG